MSKSIQNRIKELRYVRASDLQPNPRNWRTHSKEQMEALKGILDEIGYAGAALARELPNKKLELIDGHARKDVSGKGKIPVLVLDVTEEEADKILATFDPVGAMAGADKAKLDELMKAVSFENDAVNKMLDELAAGATTELPEAGDGGDEFDATPAESGPTRTQVGELWVIGGKHRLFVGDCTDAGNVGRLMKCEKAEMVWTDPPYGVSIGDKNKFLNSIARSNRVEENLQNDTLDEDGLATMLARSFDNAVTHCENGASWYVAAPPGPLHILFGMALKQRGIWRQTIQWVKNNATFSPMGVSYHWQAEPIFYGWLPNGGHRFHGDRKQTTVWNVDRPLASPDHPTMKPVDLVSRAIEHASLPDQIVYDLFLGSGTTLIAAHRLGRRCYGCEISPRYADVILKRAEAEGMTCEKAV